MKNSLPKIPLIDIIGFGKYAGIAQLVEHFTRNEGVVGSSPIFSFA